VQDEISSASREMALLQQYSEFVSDYLHLLKQNDAAKLDAIYRTFDDAWSAYGFTKAEEQDAAQSQGLVTRLVELNIDQLLDAEFEFDTRAQDEYPAYIELLSQQAAELMAHTDNRASQGIHEFSSQLKAAYDALLERPVLLESDYAFELLAQAHQEIIHLFDTLAAGQRVILSAEVEKLLSDLSAFVQQDIEQFAEEETAITEPVAVSTANGIDF